MEYNYAKNIPSSRFFSKYSLNMAQVINFVKPSLKYYEFICLTNAIKAVKKLKQIRINFLKVALGMRR
jgi:hypothetical protein